MENFQNILNVVSFAGENNSLTNIQTTVNSITQTATGITILFFSSVSGFVILVSIIWFIVEFLKYKFANNNQKKAEIWANIKKSLLIIGVIIVVLIAAGAIVSTIVNLVSNSFSGVQQIINPSSNTAPGSAGAPGA
ncbi:Uncharacterised protein [Mesomycoplasma conjunctivae]|uniref:Uncharacterized protein n=1 Tax=Mesomycoplasma conjunctivae (strain ATCC 25834 / NCTC 10147 / HRC/581) TaxID=572263 RepID=C5J6F8_MESCH|nr:hypothetical protein [Mesomycoplasma conjunctivae]CAT05050.1 HYPOTHETICAL PROTEIN MCJ_003610 [Mesomycoplasma conjunctivae]VEU66293.1 Uncharacterised protein [Mesomycoplasma conjunctivae]